MKLWMIIFMVMYEMFVMIILSMNDDSTSILIPAYDQVQIPAILTWQGQV